MKVYLKILSLILVVALSFSIVACSHNGATDNQAGNNEDNSDSSATENTDTNKENTDTETQAPVDNKENETDTKDEEVTFTPVEDDNDYTTVDNVSMESDSDKFELLDNSYGADESFVYTATSYFEMGVASGIVILFLVGCEFFIRYSVRIRRARKEETV